MIQNQAAQDRSMRDRTTGSRIPHMEEIAARDQGMQRVTLAAEMYYLYDMSQKEIADRLGVSRPWVSKLLKRARESGLVRIEIRSPLVGTPELEAGIRDHYGIDRVTVVRPLAANVYTNLNMAAASYLAAHIRAEDVVGVSWGMSIAQTIRHIIAMNLSGVRVVPVVGGAGSEAAILSNTNATNLAETLGASCMLLHAGACCADRPERDRVMSNGHVREIIEAGEKADLVLLGIGDLQNSKIVATCPPFLFLLFGTGRGQPVPVLVFSFLFTEQCGERPSVRGRFLCARHGFRRRGRRFAHRHRVS